MDQWSETSIKGNSLDGNLPFNHNKNTSVGNLFHELGNLFMKILVFNDALFFGLKILQALTTNLIKKRKKKTKVYNYTNKC